MVDRSRANDCAHPYSLFDHCLPSYRNPLIKPLNRANIMRRSPSTTTYYKAKNNSHVNTTKLRWKSRSSRSHRLPWTSHLLEEADIVARRAVIIDFLLVVFVIEIIVLVLFKFPFSTFFVIPVLLFRPKAFLSITRHRQHGVQKRTIQALLL